MTSIMVVDDDQDLAEMLGIVLTGAGYEVDLVNRGDEVMPLFASQNPDLVLLDVMLPGLNGVEVCKLIREVSMVPIVMLSAKGDKQDIVAGLEAGADDYLGKPFHIEELLARLNAVIKRSKGHLSTKIEALGLCLDEANKTVTQEDIVHNLTPIEFMLLRLFLLNPDKLFTKSRLLESLYELDSDPDSNVLEVYISRLRQKIGKDRIITRRNQGYLFKGDA